MPDHVSSHPSIGKTERIAEWKTESQALVSSSAFRSARQALLRSIAEAGARVHQIKPSDSSPEIKEAFKNTLADFNRHRGRDVYFPFLSSGLGSGPFVELLDGSVKYDMITGIGINFFGHAHPELMSEMIDALASDTMQGNLQPGFEAQELLQTMLGEVGPGSKLTRGWLTCSGTMANEIALKIIRQKKQPATKVIAFTDCFAGRSTTMQEITDNPGYRQGQPVYGEVYYLSYYDPSLGLEKSVERALAQLKSHLDRYPGKFCALMIELVQGEGGFTYGPREFYTRIFDEAKKAGLAIWLDEIQTFGRTGELFAYQKFSLQEYVDVVTVGKMLQACAVLFTDEYNPRPGLVAGTFSGSSVALRTGRRTIELLKEGGFLGREGRIEKLSNHFVERLQKIADRQGKNVLGEIRAIGGMIAFTPFGGTLDQVKAVLHKLFELGVVAFYCGHGPYLVRMLPPLGVMTEKNIDEVCDLVEKALIDIKGGLKA